MSMTKRELDDFNAEFIKEDDTDYQYEQYLEELEQQQIEEEKQKED